MTVQEAQGILKLNGAAGEDEIRRSFQTLYSEFEARASNAPTDALRGSYRGRLESVQSAYRLLSGSRESARSADLPALEPPKLKPTPAALLAHNTLLHPPESGLADKEAGEGAGSWIPWVVAIVLFGLSIYLGIGWQSEIVQRPPDLSGRVAELEGLLENGVLEIENRSGTPLEIVALTVCWRAKDGLRTFNSSRFGWPTWTVPAGGRRKLDYVSGLETKWDGSVLFYSMSIRQAGREWLVSGPWSEVKGERLRLALAD